MTRAGYVRNWSVVAGIAFASFVAARFGSHYIDVAFPDRPTPPDLLFETLPYIAWPQYLTDIVLMVAGILLVVHLARHNRAGLAPVAALFGLMELARAGIIVLTPLAGPLGNGAYYGLVKGVTQNGEFPSGHAATAMLFYLLVDKERSPRLRAVMLGLVVVECVSLLVSHGHWSVDIVGGLLLSLALHRAWTAGTSLDWLKRLVTA